MAGLKGGLDSIGSTLSDLAASIVNPIIEFLERLLVPDTDAINGKFNEILVKYGFVQSIIESGQALGNVFTSSTLADPEPPVIYMDLGAAEGEYDFGGKVAVLDLSWYARYKPVVDQFLSALMWGFFLWRVYVRLPSIISGGAGLVGRLSRDD